MTSKRLFYCLVVGFIVLTAAAIVATQQAGAILSHRAAVLAQVRADSTAIDDQQRQLVQDKTDLRTYADLNTIARTVVPQDKDQAEAVKEVVELARRSGIDKLGSIAFAPSTLGAAVPATLRGLTQVTPVVGMPGLYTLPITITQPAGNEVPYRNFISFLSALEQNRRTAQVTSINVVPDADDANRVSFTLVINEFIKP